MYGTFPKFDFLPLKYHARRTIALHVQNNTIKSLIFCRCSQLATAVEFLHKNLVTHGDLALRNVLLSKQEVTAI
jgi:tRNA A-37 threonylcarbamoyl transferase component Bud32